MLRMLLVLGIRLVMLWKVTEACAVAHFGLDAMRHSVVVRRCMANGWWQWRQLMMHLLLLMLLIVVLLVMLDVGSLLPRPAPALC